MAPKNKKSDKNKKEDSKQGLFSNAVPARVEEVIGRTGTRGGRRMRRVERLLRERIADLQKELDNVERDRKQFRDEFSQDFRWLIETHGEGKHPEMNSYIQKKAKALASFDWWYW